MSKRKYHPVDLNECEYLDGDGVEYEIHRHKKTGLVYRVPIRIQRYHMMSTIIPHPESSQLNLEEKK